jgi:hypothetical protein
MIKLTGIYTLLILGILRTDFQCEKCDIAKVQRAYENLDNLTTEIVGEFLCTFDNKCKVNVEFSQWSNETLFRVLESSPETFFESLKHYKVDRELIIREIDEPIEDFDLQTIYLKIKQTPVSADIDTFKTRILNSLILATDKGGQKIIR